MEELKKLSLPPQVHLGGGSLLSKCLGVPEVLYKAGTRRPGALCMDPRHVVEGAWGCLGCPGVSGGVWGCLKVPGGIWGCLGVSGGTWG